MAKEQASPSELLPLLESSDLLQLEKVKTSINDLLLSDRGGVLLCSLVDYYVETGSPQAVLLLSSVREPNDKPLLEKLNEGLLKPGCRLACLSILGEVVCRQPPWIHKISRCPLLASLLKCLKSDSDPVVLITGVLVLVSLLPMIPQAAKQHIYDFFDVFGRLASWSQRNTGHVHAVYVVHLHAGVYCLFHRLYGMFPCNFISYLRSHYSMKENLSTFQDLVKPMLEHVRVHPELVTGTQDYELDPSRWKTYEVHDIVIECAKVSLDPKDSSCEDSYSTLPDPPLLQLSPSPGVMGSPISTPLSMICPPMCWQQPGNTSYIQSQSGEVGVTWSPSSQCGLATPPASRGISPVNVPEPSLSSSLPPGRTASISGGKCPSSATTPVALSPANSMSDENYNVSLTSDRTNQPTPLSRPIGEDRGQLEVTNNNNKEGGRSMSLTEVSEFLKERDITLDTASKDTEDEAIAEELMKLTESQPVCSSSLLPSPVASTPHHSHPPPCSLRPSFSPIQATGSSRQEGEAGGQGLATPYEPLFQLALPRAAVMFLGRKSQEVLQRAGADQEELGQEESSPSPLEVLDRLVLHGLDAHEGSRRLSTPNKSVDWSNFGGKEQSMKTKGHSEDLQAVGSQLLLLSCQLQYERFKRQQHAMRNRRLLRRIINATALEEHSISMMAQVRLQEVEIQSLRSSLAEEQRRYKQLQKDSQTHTQQLQTQLQTLLLQQQHNHSRTQELQSELQECKSVVGDLEAELQKANNEAYNAEHQLTQLSIKLSSSEELQHQIHVLNRQLVLLGETNRLLVAELERSGLYHNKEVSMLWSNVSREHQRLQDREVQQSQRLEAAQQRLLEVEAQVAKKDQLILEQKKMLEDVKDHNRDQLLACESRCEALRRITQALQTEMLQLYSQTELEEQATPSVTPVAPPQDPGPNRANGSSVTMTTAQGSHGNKTSSSVINGGLDPLSTSPLHLLSSSSPLSLSPIDAPLAVGSYPTESSILGQRARQLFRQPGEEEEEEEEEREEGCEASSVSGEEAESHSRPGPQSVAPSLPAPSSETGSSHLEAPRTSGPLPGHPTGSRGVPTPRALTQAVRQRRDELSIMDYDETLPEY